MIKILIGMFVMAALFIVVLNGESVNHLTDAAMESEIKNLVLSDENKFKDINADSIKCKINDGDLLTKKTKCFAFNKSKNKLYFNVEKQTFSIL
jgi:hypothetical protein